MTTRATLWSRHVSGLIERLPRLYRMALILRHRNSPFLRRIVSPGHDLVIEGFPRSASSFAVAAFMASNGWRDPRVATHVHSPAQVILAARWGIPTIVTVRAPEAAVVGWMAFARQSGHLPAEMHPRQEARWVQVQTVRYARFHDAILPCRAHIVLASFEQTTQDFGAVLARLNARFGCAFETFDHSPAAQARIFERARRHLSPDPARDALKARFADLYHAPANAACRHRAETVYRALMTPAPAGGPTPESAVSPPGFPRATGIGHPDAPVS